MGIISKLASQADPQRSTGRCRVCVLLERLDPDDAEELRELMREPVEDWNHKRVWEVITSDDVRKKYPALPTVNKDNIAFHRNTRH